MSPADAEDDATDMQTAENVTTPLRTSDEHQEKFSESHVTSDAFEETPADAGRSVSIADVSRKRLRVLRSSLWTNFPFIVYCTVVAAVQGCIQSVLIFLPARGRELGAGPNAAALLLTLFGVCDMAGRFIFGFVFDLRAVRQRGRSYVYLAVAASFGATAALMAAAGEYATLATCTCVVAVLEAGAHSQRATSVTEMVKPSQMATGVGLVIFAQGVGNFYGPIVGG